MSATPDPDEINSTARGILPNSIAEGSAAKTNDNARRLNNRLTGPWNFPQRLTRDGVLTDVSAAMAQARDQDGIKEAFGHAHPFLAATLAGENYERGMDDNVDAVIERAAPDNERAGPIDAGIVQSASPVQVDPLYVDIQSDAAPLLDMVQFEAQAGFTAQYNIINDRSRPIGNVDESDALDLSGNQKGDYGVGTKTRDMGIYVDQIEVSDFTQRATDTLGSGALDVSETATAQRMKVHARFTAGELLYGDPSASLSDGSIEDSNATPGLARIAQDADTNNVGGADNVKSKSGTSSGFLEDLKSEITSLVTNTGASYDDLAAVCSPTFFDAIENEANTVVRLGGYDEDINFGNRGITIKNSVPLREVRAAGRSEHGQISYSNTNFTPDPGDVFIFDQSTFRRRQLAPLATVPLGRVGLADKAAMFEYKANIDKSHGAHTKYLQAYDF
jgi:hypothetical protein